LYAANIYQQDELRRIDKVALSPVTESSRGTNRNEGPLLIALYSRGKIDIRLLGESTIRPASSFRGDVEIEAVSSVRSRSRVRRLPATDLSYSSRCVPDSVLAKN